MEEIKKKLDKIIELLEFRNSIERARDQMRRGTMYFDDSEVFPDEPSTPPELRKEYYPFLEPVDNGGTSK